MFQQAFSSSDRSVRITQPTGQCTRITGVEELSSPSSLSTKNIPCLFFKVGNSSQLPVSLPDQGRRVPQSPPIRCLLGTLGYSNAKRHHIYYHTLPGVLCARRCLDVSVEMEVPGGKSGTSFTYTIGYPVFLITHRQSGLA